MADVGCYIAFYKSREKAQYLSIFSKRLSNTTLTHILFIQRSVTNVLTFYRKAKVKLLLLKVLILSRHYIPALCRHSKCFFRSLETMLSVFKIFVFAFNRFALAKFNFLFFNFKYSYLGTLTNFHLSDPIYKLTSHKLSSIYHL